MKRLWRRMHRGNKGFTLIELLIVVAIIGVLAAVALPALFRFMGAGEYEAARAELKTIQTAMDAAMLHHRITTVVGQGDPGIRNFGDAVTGPPAFPAAPDIHPGLPEVRLYPDFLRVRMAGALRADGTTRAAYSWGADGRITSTAIDPVTGAWR